ncbi:hypothetical protein P3T36_000500 [Kitasatospora sp. MAP12-15]|uniref:penicillin-binding transpeptidase domain-containing protein n=1 Tax=unclassified Kitasatospora TaxID=2633591 RepID=UPI00247607B6|nr:penicillin-binding transpeptidase domain-containing protein [Kitasatospora sp. MAP12-44]MDH6109729.1 hypothetical protein [Kitasatospora sp. MAP12-44]
MDDGSDRYGVRWDTDGEDYGEEYGDEPVARLSTRTVLKVGLAGVVLGLFVVGGLGAYNLGSAIEGGSHTAGPPGPGRSAAPTTDGAPPSAVQAAAVEQAFLSDWAGGDLAGAGALTDGPADAVTALTAFRDTLQPTSLAFAPSGPLANGLAVTPGQLTLGFKATVTFAGAPAPWTYDGQVGVQRGADGRTLVHWAPTVIHPQLGPGESIGIRAVAALDARTTDRKGRPLDTFPSLAPLLAALQPPDASAASPSSATSPSSTASPSGGTPGKAVVITGDSGDSGSNPADQLFVISQPTAGHEDRLTLDADLQAAAEAAVAQQSAGVNPASLVAIEPSTGDILAVANAPAGGFNGAFLADVAPGSTMKVITAAALLEAGDQPQSAVPCKATTNSPKLWRNDEAGDHLDYTLADDFAQSCNTAFIDESHAKLAPGALAQTAQQFGIGQAWSTGPGVSSFDAVIPPPTDSDDAAAEVIGQGGIQANPLTMASVAATVENGTFRQPVLRPGQPQVAAAHPLPAAVAQELRAMMARTAADGTARAAMAGLTGRVGAKTGTAQVDGAPAPNSWFIAYRGNLAVAAEIQGGGYGAVAAGQAVAHVLAVGNPG